VNQPAISWESSARARIYDLLHRGTPGDIAFYRHVCAGAASVLELGCGSGRVLVELARAGLTVTGLDHDPAKLARAAVELQRERLSGPRLVEGDMASFDLAERFDRVLVPYNALCALPNDEAVLACFRAAALHLAPGGRLWFDVYSVDDAVLDEPTLDEESEDEFAQTLSAVDAEGRVDVWESERQLRIPRRVDIHYKYELTPPKGGPATELSDCIQHLLLPPRRVRELLAEAGFDILAEHGDFDPAPLDDVSQTFIVGATLRGPS
jgi:SAM-dependent methyltransferase